MNGEGSVLTGCIFGLITKSCLKEGVTGADIVGEYCSRSGSIGSIGDTAPYFETDVGDERDVSISGDDTLEPCREREP